MSTKRIVQMVNENMEETETMSTSRSEIQAISDRTSESNVSQAVSSLQGEKNRTLILLLLPLKQSAKRTY